MIPVEWKDYLESYILLKNEELLLNEIDENHGMIDIDVIRRTARTRRVVARLTIGVQTEDSVTPPDELIKAFISPNVKKHVSLTDQTFRSIRHGWLIREYRLEKDERTVKKEQYRMGYVLFQYQQFLEKQRIEENKQLVIEWKKQMHEMDKPKALKDPIRSELLSTLKNRLDDISEHAQQYVEDKAHKLEDIPPTWRFRKQILFMHFLLALYQMAHVETHYDWKQIGARYYKRIGGSKEFDPYKKEFIEEVESLLDRPLHLLGLTSLGTITPLFFSGPMRGGKVEYDYGSVHATTDLAVFTDNFETDAEVLWLVENRGVLTRMAYEEDFLRDSKSFILGIDGQLRSAHRKLIENLLSYVSQVMIWTDVDEAGLTIAKDVFQVTQDGKARTKIVVPPLEIVTDIEMLEARYKQAIEDRKEEQEEEMGGVEYWKKWISH